MGTTLSGPNKTGFLYRWKPENSLINYTNFQTIAKPSLSQTYTLTLTNDKGCKSEDTIRVNVNNRIWIPNIFTPNGDNQNDVWILANVETYPDIDIEVTVYNHWGEVVFYSKGYKTVCIEENLYL